MCGQAAALAATQDRTPFANLSAAHSLRESSLPSARRPPSPLDFYLSWMSPHSSYSYDALHRVLNVKYPSGPNHSGTAQKYFVYDSATVNSQTMQLDKGHLAEAYTCTSWPATRITDLGFSYSKRGEATDVYQSTTHSGGYYHMTASYWAHGGGNTFGLLSSTGTSLIPTQTYGVDGEGRPASVTAASGQNPVSAVTYTNGRTTEPLGSLTNVTLGSGDTDNFTYDPNTGRMTEYKFNIGTTPSVVKQDLTWNANGTLAKLA